ncbi:hypothetical protein EV175_003008, partial [Coemansia sp. RSA 1933]
MDRYPPGIVLGVCVAALCLATTLVTVVALSCRRRNRTHQTQAKTTPQHDGNEEEASVATHDITAAAQPRTIDDETQPLLSESAIRSRYADNANEFARSFIEHPVLPAGSQDPEALTQSCGPSFDLAENVVSIMQSDSSDSGIDSTASGSDNDDNSACRTRGSSAVSVDDGNSGESASLTEYRNQTNHTTEYVSEPKDESGPAAGLVQLAHVSNKASPSDTAAAYAMMHSASTERRDRSATTCTSSVGSTDTDKESAPSSAVGRPRSSTLNVQAKAFVPTACLQAPASGNHRS